MTDSTASTAQIAVAVSTVIFSVRPGTDGAQRLMLPLVKRTREPHIDAWALPGGWLHPDESLNDAARRTLDSATGLRPEYIEQLYAFGDVERAPTRVVSIVYSALLRSDRVAAASERENVAWFPADDPPPLAFDHAQILTYGLWRLRTKAAYTRIAHALLPDEFTLTDLRDVYEIVLAKRLDPANFRRLIEGSESVVATEGFRGGKHRPARLYRRNDAQPLADTGPIGQPTMPTP